MKWQQKAKQGVLNFLHTTLKTTHGRIVLGGLLVGLCYFPVWLGGLTVAAAKGLQGYR